MPESTKAALVRIAKEKSVEPAELLRRAAYAIVEYAIVNGDKTVPLDMQIGPVNAPSETSIKLAEELYSIIKREEKKKK